MYRRFSAGCLSGSMTGPESVPCSSVRTGSWRFSPVTSGPIPASDAHVSLPVARGDGVVSIASSRVMRHPALSLSPGSGGPAGESGGPAPGGGKPLGGPKVRPVYPLRPVRRNRTDSSVLAPSLTGALPRNGYGVTRTARGAVTKSPCPVPTAPCASSNTAPVSPWETPRTRPPNSPGVSCSKAAMDPSVTSTSR